MSGKKRQAKLDAIKAACQAFIGGDLLAQLSMTLADAITAAGQEPGQPRVELDADDESRQSLLLWYPSVTEAQRTQAALLTWPSSSMSSDRAVILCSRSEEHTSELQSLMRISYAVFGLKKKKK